MHTLGRDGFITSYLSKIVTEDFSSSAIDRNQLRLEARLRKEVSSKKAETIQQPQFDSTWSPWYQHGSIFLDRSDFYHTLKRVTMLAAATLYADDDLQTEAVLWTYMATGVYLNGKLLAESTVPVYKPIENVKLTLNLKKGRNELLFLSDNLGVRDTKNMIAFQVLGNQEHLCEGFPVNNDEYTSSALFLDGIEIGEGTLSFPSPSPSGTRVVNAITTVDYLEKLKTDRSGYDVTGKSSVTVVDAEGCSVVLSCGMARRFEFTERIKPELLPKRATWDEHFGDILSRIASVSMLDRGTRGYAIFSLLARKKLGIVKGDETELLKNDIALIKERGDCADFLICGLSRYIHEYGLPEELQAEAKDALTDFRYWMTMKGTDGMCFWSENHSLIFWYSAADMGALYPDEYFHRAGMTGKELHAYGERRVSLWLDDVLSHGYEEFLSSTYMAVTFAVLLNCVDYLSSEISKKAWKALDMIMHMLSDSTFCGSLIAPMGRVYRGVIYPFREATASLLNAASQDAYYAYGEGWISYLATSRYHFPEDLEARMLGNILTDYSTGNAMVHVEKNDSYIITSVHSPRNDKAFIRWSNTFFSDDADAEDNHFVKSLNECFHGTSCFQPGVYGYQQHMWSVALSGEAVVFANHPGTTSEDAELRPGYWNGNGVMPAVRAEKGILASVYSIPENHPVGFVHLYVPFSRFEQCREEGSWIFLSQRNGYLAIWMSGDRERYDDVIHDSEVRIHDRDVAVIVIAGRKSEESFDDFIARAKAERICFDKVDKTLFINGSEFIHYVPVDDKTQYLD
ncbi:MAG: hypothetical protein IAA97_00310 [Spirochaetes bacterium]|uniref:Uncharacterized protein n=1 Tax=Candidatus Ornithospirochaeta stercoripullorum TaxID=2840899 RepID=A0A9D9H5C3_9SPIO|nr:hypothetical protein [Candidatus Ornithospirochaeta stercoripullorum]